MGDRRDSLGNDDRFLRCARCGDRIGFYEEACLQDAAGSLKTMGGLQARRENEAGPAFHVGCLAPDQAPHTSA